MGASDSDNDSAASASASAAQVQVRITLTLAPECADRSLQVPKEPIAVPADTGRKGLSAVINHLLGRKHKLHESDDDDDDDDNSDDDNSDNDKEGIGNRSPALPAIPFECTIDSSNRLLRTGIEREARRSGLTLEEAVAVSYFPAQQAPESSGESEPLPDWIAALSYVPATNNVCAGCYDGSIIVFRTETDAETKTVSLERVTATKSRAHGGPIQCLSSAADYRGDSKNDSDSCRVWIATGSMDHSLQLHQLDTDTCQMNVFGNCKGGHVAAISSVDLYHSSHHKLLASGDWDGGVCIWDYAQQPAADQEEEEKAPAVKKTKTGSSQSVVTAAVTRREPVLAPKISIRAHSSKVSGVSWGNYEKFSDPSPRQPRHLTTGSWDHSIKVWDVERQDCLLTLNGSRVVSCLNTSYHSAGIVATGHPDCTVRLWDTRTADDSKESSLLVADTTFRPSHKEWISAVNWSRDNPYHLASTSHDGTVKLWDIRSPLPLHTVRAFPKGEKGLSLCYGGCERGYMFAGGTDCTVKQFRCAPAVEKHHSSI